MLYLKMVIYPLTNLLLFLEDLGTFLVFVWVTLPPRAHCRALKQKKVSHLIIFQSIQLNPWLCLQPNASNQANRISYPILGCILTLNHARDWTILCLKIKESPKKCSNFSCVTHTNTTPWGNRIFRIPTITVFMTTN